MTKKAEIKKVADYAEVTTIAGNEADAEATESTESAVPVKTEDKSSKGRVAFEVLMAVLLALAALGIAWATWMSQLHGSNEAQNYAESSALRTEGTTMEVNVILSLSTMQSIWNDVTTTYSSLKFYESQGDTAQVQVCQEQIDNLLAQLGTDELVARGKECLESGNLDDFLTSDLAAQMYSAPEEYLTESEEKITRGNKDNLLSDAFAFVNVLYSLVLFLMASLNIIKNYTARKVLVGVSCVVFVIATFYMASLPLPTGFDFNNYVQFFYTD